jgi:hypothetical protein
MLFTILKPRYNRKGTLSRYPSLLEGTAGVQYRVPRFPARFASIGGPSPLGGIVKLGFFVHKIENYQLIRPEIDFI